MRTEGRLSADDALALLRANVLYDPDTGIFVRTSPAGPSPAGAILGGKNSDGYIQFTIRGYFFYAHRAAWLLTRGYWPKYVDHVNSDRSDNRLGNLREASQSQNSGNARRSKQNKTGRKGVYRHSTSGAFVAQIVVNRRAIYLGSFKNKDEAHAAYVDAANRLFGEFARAA